MPKQGGAIICLVQVYLLQRPEAEPAGIPGRESQGQRGFLPSHITSHWVQALLLSAHVSKSINFSSLVACSRSMW